MGVLYRPNRYCAPAVPALHMTKANKVTKMLPHKRHSSRTALKGNPSRQHSPAADTYRPTYGSSYQFSSTYSDHGQEDYRGYRGGGYYGREAGKGSWAAHPGQYEGHSAYYDYRDRLGGRSPLRAPNALPPQISRESQYYDEHYQQDQAARERQSWDQRYWEQARWDSHVPPAAPARQGNWQGHQQDYDSATGWGRQQPSYPQPYQQAAYGQQEVYVLELSYIQQQPPQYGYQAEQHLTHEGVAVPNLSANATTFQPRRTNDGQQQTLDNFFPGVNTQRDYRGKTKTPPQPTKAHKVAIKRPKPTLAYLKAANQEPQTFDEPRKLLVVLDLNGTLLHRKARGGSNFAARPKVDEFLEYLFAHHRVMVWSSAKPANVEPMCRKLFSDEQYQRLVAIWARNTLRIPAGSYHSKVQVYKQLSWIWSDDGIQSEHGDIAGVWDQSNTVLIDDSVEKAASEPYNSICLEEFEDRPEQKESDVLGQVVKYLEGLKHEKDVSAFMRILPFRYEPGEVFDWRI